MSFVLQSLDSTMLARIR